MTNTPPFPFIKCKLCDKWICWKVDSAGVDIAHLFKGKDSYRNYCKDHVDWEKTPVEKWTRSMRYEEYHD